MIVMGQFENESRLDELSLAEHFGVSRTPVREALQTLVHTGLAEQIPRRGVFVSQPGPVKLFEMFEVMAELEALCGRLAARNISDDAIAEMEQTNLACRKAVEQGDSEDYFRINEDFHAIIYRESGNAFLNTEAGRLHRRLRPFRRLQLRVRGRMAQSMSEHEAIVEAMKSGSSDRTADLLRKHVAVQGDKFSLLVSSYRSTKQR